MYSWASPTERLYDNWITNCIYSFSNEWWLNKCACLVDTYVVVKDSEPFIYIIVAVIKTVWHHFCEITLSYFPNHVIVIINIRRTLSMWEIHITKWRYDSERRQEIKANDFLTGCRVPNNWQRFQAQDSRTKKLKATESGTVTVANWVADLCVHSP